MIGIQLQNRRIDRITHLPIAMDVLRLDLIHPEISGNKWFKLKGYLEEARRQNKTTLASFGGAWSNHILATAAAAQEAGLRSIGFIRGESRTRALEDAARLGMELHFLSREDYRSKQIPAHLASDPAILVIPEGGYGKTGARGAASLLEGVDVDNYTHFLTAAGTGTTLAGLALQLRPHQSAIGISVLKNNFSLEAETRALLEQNPGSRLQVIHEYSFGGYARNSARLFGFMNQWYSLTGIPTDFVYTAKAFYAAGDLALKGFFPPGARVLAIHTGGLQGNRSLPKGTLIF